MLSGSERRIQVGDSYATHLEHLPAVTYAAFGHIHKPQDLPGSLVNGCYAGSPIQLDFGELGEAKRIVLVEARPGHPPEVQSLPLSGGRPLWRFEGTLEQLAEAAAGVGRALALLTIHSPSTIADLRARVQDLLSRRCHPRRLPGRGRPAARSGQSPRRQPGPSPESRNCSAATWPSRARGEPPRTA